LHFEEPIALIKLTSLIKIKVMSSRRRQQSEGSTRISDDQIIDLVCKLRQLVPEIHNRRSDKVL